jgi:hypothetical protein
LKVVVVGLHELARLVLHLAVRELVLLRVRVFDVADRAVDLLHVRGDAFVALAADARGPLDRGAFADGGLELGAHLREVVGPDERRSRAVRAMHDGDRVGGSFTPGLSFAIAGSFHFVILPR